MCSCSQSKYCAYSGIKVFLSCKKSHSRTMQHHWSHFFYSSVFSIDHMLILHAPHADHTQHCSGWTSCKLVLLRQTQKHLQIADSKDEHWGLILTTCCAPSHPEKFGREVGCRKGRDPGAASPHVRRSETGMQKKRPYGWKCFLMRLKEGWGVERVYLFPAQ